MDMIDLTAYREMRAQHWPANLACRCARKVAHVQHAIVPQSVPRVSERAARIRDEISLFCGR